MRKFFGSPIVVIVIIAAFIRVPFAILSPQPLNQDEAAKGYNAYSLIRTGKSFRGISQPLYFTDFSDRLPSVAIVYTYSTVPFVMLFGLTQLAVRIPAVLYGVATIVALYLLTFQLSRNKKIALISAGTLAISPWHIFLSWHAVEPITYPFFFLTGWYLLERASVTRRRYYYLGVGILAISLYSYQTALIQTPLFLVLFFIFRERNVLKKQALFVVRLIFLFVLIALPISILYLTKFSLMSAHYEELSYSQQISSYFIFCLLSYSTHLLFPFLVFTYTIPTIYYAIMSLRNRIRQEHLDIIFVATVLLLAIVPPSMVISNYIIFPDPTRSVGKFGIIEILAAYGIYYATNKLRAKRKARIIAALLILNSILLIPFTLKYYSDRSIGYGFQTLSSYLNDNGNNYEKIVITDKGNQNFIHLLFYSKYPPEKFTSEDVRRHYIDSKQSTSYEIVDGFGKYEFCDISKCYGKWDNALYVSRPGEIQINNRDETENINSSIGTVFQINY